MASAEENFIFYGVISFLVLEYLWELFLSLRQHNIYKNAVKIPSEVTEIINEETYTKARLYGLDKSTFSIIKELFSICTTRHNIYKNAVKIPSEVTEIINEETYTKARLYGLDKSTFSIIKELFSICTTIGIILLNGFPYFWHLAGNLLENFGYDPDNELLRSAAFVLIMNIFTTIHTLPFTVYHTFVLEEKHGFNKQTIGFFIKDKVKAFIVGQIIILPITSGVVYIVRIGGDYFFIYLWLFAMVMTFVLFTIYPNLIAPLFDKYTPLPDGELKKMIEELAASIEFPLYKLYVVEGSKRSMHSNAYFYGFFKNKRIVLFDTLLKDYVPEGKTAEEIKEVPETEKKGCDNDEVLAVLAHELGHWKLNHVLKNMIIMQVNLFLMFSVFGLLFNYDAMYHAFGFQEKPVLIGLLIVLQFIFSPYTAVLGFLLTILSRRFEFQADAFAKKLGKSTYLRRALIKLHKDNLSFPVYDWLYSMWHHSHPQLLERLKALGKDD